MSWRARVVPERAGPLLAGGVLMGLAHPPFHLLVTSFIALVPFIVWLEGLPSTAEGRKQARTGGFFFGLIYYTLVLYWLFVALVFYTWWAVFAFLAPILILSAFMSWVAGGIHLVRSRFRWPLYLVFPVFWTAREVMGAHVLEFAFPWMQFGDSLSGYPILIGAADLVGSRGLSFWLAAANALIAMGFLAFRARGWRAARGPALGLLITLAGPIAYSVARWQTHRTREELETAIRPLRIGGIEDIIVLERGPSDRVVRVEIRGTIGRRVVSGPRLRTLLGLRDSLVFMDEERNRDRELLGISFFGSGWGHGVGLCQVGAYGMAMDGATVEEILKTYYRGIELERVF